MVRFFPIGNPRGVSANGKDSQGSTGAGLVPGFSFPPLLTVNRGWSTRWPSGG